MRAISKVSARIIDQTPNKSFIILPHFVFAFSSISKKPVKPGLYSVIRWHILRVLLPLYGTKVV